MGFDLGGGFAAGAGADALEDVLKRAFLEQQARIRNKQEQQRIALEAQRNQMAMADRQAGMADLAQSRAIQNATKLTGMLRPGQSVTPDTVSALKAGDMGDLVQHEAADLPSRAISGSAQAGPKAPIVGALRMMQAGRPDRDTFTGTQQQLAAEQARKDRLAADAQTRQDRIDAAAQAKTDKEDLLRTAAELRAPAQTHARFNTTQGTDKDGKPIIIRTNMDSGDVTVLPMPEGVNFAKREQPTTADQTNLAIYASRLEQAVPELNRLQPVVSKMNPVAFETQAYFDKPYLQSKDMQSYQQAARMFINSVLRRESGAAISQSEFAEARKQYLPMPGDSPEVLAQKAMARQRVIDDFKKGAGPAAQRITPNAAPGGVKVLSITEIK